MRQRPPLAGLRRPRERLLAILLTLVVAGFHLQFFLAGGPLWRDEITSVTIATRGSFSDVVANLKHDSFPILWHCIVRMWVFSGVGKTDLGIRLLGLLAGLGIVGMLWMNAWRFGRSTPVASLTLLFLSSASICYVDSIRAYGLGMVAGLMAFGAIWELTQCVTPLKIASALLVSLLSVHLLFYNSVWLFAACCGGAGVCLLNRQSKRALLILAIGATCGVTMLVYLPTIRGRAPFAALFQTNLSFSAVAERFQDALAAIPEGGTWRLQPDLLWATSALTGLIAAAVVWRRRPGQTGEEQSLRQSRDIAAFSAITLIVGTLAYWSFLVALKYHLRPWYFFAGMAMVAACVDGLFAVARWPRFRAALLVAIGVVGVINGRICWASAHVRMSNVDAIASALEAAAKPGDLIAVSPWWLGVTFNRYYHGSAPWVLIPPIQKSDFQQYDLILPKLKHQNAVDPVLHDLSAVLRGDHRVWVVYMDGIGMGALSSEPPAQWPSELNELASYCFWNQQIVHLLTQHNVTLRGPVLFDDGGPINPYEAALCIKADGWREDESP